MADSKFQRRIEDFTCEHCGFHVVGNGYTNHCPKCLWSKHVDVNPGDRAHVCGGMMQPIRVEGTSPDYTLVHRCVKCNFEKRNIVATDDDVDAILAVVRKE